MCVCVCVCVYVYNMCICVYVYVCMCVCVYVCMCVCMCVCMYVCMYVLVRSRESKRVQEYSDTDALVWMSVSATVGVSAREPGRSKGSQHHGEPESTLGLMGGVAQQGVALSSLFVHEFADEFLSTFECQCFVGVYWLPFKSPEINTSAVGGVQPR
jgi:hypothetical protein